MGNRPRGCKSITGGTEDDVDTGVHGPVMDV